MFNAIVLALTLVVLAFVVAWLAIPGLRIWIEAPKFRMLEQEARFEAAANSKSRPPSRNQIEPAENQGTKIDHAE